MAFWQNLQGRGNRSLWVSASAAALMVGTALPTYAQEAEEEDEIVTTGIRQSLKSAQELKANADTFVDAITAEDIGALPDRSVSEALQRVPGVSIIRFSGANDPDHFDVEGSGVVVRGLPFVRSELNGRDVFAATDSGVLGFEDVSPELLGSVVVFKNQSADLIEGGLAGSIDLRTRLPFDNGGKRVIAGSIEGTYSDLSEEFNPSGSALLSNTWDTKSGRFGLLVNGSFNQLESQADSIQISAFEQPVVNDIPTGPFIPGGGGIRRQEFDRERQAFAAAAQWENPDQTILATAQFLRSDASTQWGENAVESGVDGIIGRRGELDQTDFTFDDDNVFQSGTITDNSVWRGPAATAALVPANGGQHQNISRERLEENVTNDFGFNVKYSPNDNLRFNFDAQYVDSTAEITDLQFGTSFLSSIFIDLSDDDDPVFQFVPPAGEDASFFSDPSNFFIRNFLDHRTDNEAESLAFRGDVEYDFSNDGWLKSVRAGVRYSDQDTTLRESDFNWGNVSELWTARDISGLANGNFNDNVSILLLGGNSNPALNDLVSPLFGTRSLDNFNRQGGASVGIPGGLPTYIGPGVNDFDGYAAVVNSIIDAAGGPTGSGPCGSPYRPLAFRACTNGDSLIPGTPFLESEVGSIDRQTFAAYTRLDFGWDDILGGEGISLSGNVGLRYVNTDRTATSLQIAPSSASLFNQNQRDLCDPAVRLQRQAANPGGGSIDTPGFCSLDLAALDAAFGDGSVRVTPVNVNYDEWLPSLNLKLDLDNGHLVRFAASRTLSRPSVTELSQRPVIRTVEDTFTNTPNGTGGTINTFGGFVGSQSGNAQLTPQLSTNLDLSWEWYFDDSGSITLTTFYKSIDDFINSSPLAVLAPDGTPLQISGQQVPFNSFVNETDDEATLKGVEFAYQQFYDFLPGALSGLGMQFNYSYIDSDGIEPTINPSLPTNDPVVPNFEIDRGVFPRISEHNINLIGLYEKGPVQARVAYSWRSEFQLTPRDVIFPNATIYQPSTGQLDASLFFDVNENWKIGAQAVNLLDDVTETTQSINSAGLRAPRSFFRNDRRFSLIARATF